ncbi:MAG: hypothetical protein GQE15_29385 [Archangiaceae bacterium]|nr:hypothetical protein [Archangiaceae bacterium]
MVSSVALCLALAATPTKTRIAVTGLASAGEVDPKVAEAIGESVTAEVAARGYFEPISAGEIATLLGVERQKQLLGCGDDATSCMTEVASALGAPYVMSGSLTKLEGIFQLNLQVIDSAKARTLGRSTKIARDFEGLRSLIPYAVAEACGTPLPPPPSRALPITLISVGGLSFVGGGVLGLIALNTESATTGALTADDKNPSVLSPAETYRARFAETALQRTLALSALIAGATLIGLGVFFMPPDAPQPGVRVSLVPTLGGAAIVGVLP